MAQSTSVKGPKMPLPPKLLGLLGQFYLLNTIQFG